MIQSLELFYSLSHLNLELGNSIVIAFGNSSADSGEDALLFEGILSKLSTQVLDFTPHCQVAVGAGFLVMQAFHIDNSLIVFRNQTSQKLCFPTNQRALHEGVDIFLFQDIALSKHCNLFRIFFKGAEVFPNGSRRFTEQLAAFFRSEIFEYVFLSAVLTVGIQIEAFFAGLLGNLLFQSLQVLAGFYASLDAVEAGQIEGSNSDIGIGLRIGRTHFNTRSLIVVQIAD